MYLDDGLGCHSDRDVCQTMTMEIKQDLLDCRFVPKVEKSRYGIFRLPFVVRQWYY